MRQLARLCGVFVMIALMLAACGRGGGNDDAEVQNQVATGVAATQAAQDATAEAAIAQAVDATVTALTAQDAADAGDEPGDDAADGTPSAEETPTTEPKVPTPTEPAVVLPPTEAADPPTPTATQQPTPTPIALVILPGGGGGDGLDGDIVTIPGIFTIDDDPDTPVFSRALSIQLLVHRPETGPQDGAGIEEVEIEVRNEEGEAVYTNVEENAGYCLFGGGSPACNILRLEPGVVWPGDNRPMQNGSYVAIFRAYADRANDDRGEWNQFFEICIPGNGAAEGEVGQEAKLMAELVESGRGNTYTTVSDSLVFQIEAYDSGQGDSDGDGIKHVVLRILGPDGDEVYRKQENSAAYCAFGGDAPCDAWNFADRNYRWPDGDPIKAGRHRLQALVVGNDGDNRTFEWEVEIR